jgi:hypothetical protein
MRGSGAPNRLPLGFIPPYLPTASPKPPVVLAWVHAEGWQRIRLFTRQGYDWSGRYARIAEALASNPDNATVHDFSTCIFLRPWHPGKQ